MFKLLRHFSISSLIAFIIVAALLGVFYRQLVLSNLFEIAESKNVALTQAFSNSLWPQFAPFVASASQLNPDELRAHPEIAKLRQAVLAEMKDLTVVKVKVYNLDGLTVFSTEAKQIGEDKSQNAGFLAARTGQVASELTHRDTFSAFEGVIENRDLFSSYIPIRPGGSTGPVEAVFEVYDDVTPLVRRLDEAQRNVIIGVTLILLSLYLILFIIVRHADQIIQRQYNELQRSGEALAQAHDRTLEASRLKTQLLANVGHDLRTPLNAILGYSEMLQEGVYGVLSTQQRGATAEIIDSTGQLLNFVNNLLDQAQIESGQVVLKTAPFAPTDLLDMVLSTTGPLARIKELELTYEIAPDMPPILYGDLYWLCQILVNLVSNAVKFTAQGTVNIRFYLAEATQWAMQVSDTGPGIPTEAQAYIFDTFRQVDGTSTRSHTGAGLGLSIVKQLTILMGGHITLTSQVGAGSTFTICLPLVQVPEEVA
jgi:signal transduction histidine kinase